MPCEAEFQASSRRGTINIPHAGDRIPEPVISIVCRIDMASNIPHHDQKNRIFAKRERALIHAIKKGFSREKIATAAERLREAKIAVFKCRFALYTIREPHTFSAEEMAISDEQVRKWISMRTIDIIEMYRPRAKPPGHGLVSLDPPAPSSDATSESN